jgi:transcriptional regulator with XRE-family HTH domain
MVSVDTANASDERFIANLHAAREEAGLSHQDVAVKMQELGFDGFVRQTVQRIESGRRGVSVGEGIALAECVGSPFLDLALRSADARHEAAGLALATRRFRESAKRLAAATVQHAQDRGRLERAVKRARSAGFAGELGREIAFAERLLVEAVPEIPHGQPQARSGAASEEPLLVAKDAFEERILSSSLPYAEKAAAIRRHREQAREMQADLGINDPPEALKRAVRYLADQTDAASNERRGA